MKTGGTDMKSVNMIQRTASLIAVGLFLTATMVGGSPASAAPPIRNHAIQRHAPHIGPAVPGLRSHYPRPYVRRARPYYPRGPFFRSRSRVSLFVGVPIGAFFTTLPGGYTAVVMNGVPYYVADGIYYQPVLGGYRVVEAPREVVVVTIPQEEKTTPAIPAEEVQVTAAALNVHTGPGLSYRVIDEVQRGDILRVLDSAAGWLNVQLPSGRSGWVMDSFTVPVTGEAQG
jgi:hypothetical protein